jgi:hypothetical protein
LLQHLAVCLLVACLDGTADPIVRAPDASQDTAGDAARSDASAALAKFALYYDNLAPSADAADINFIVKVHNLTGADVALRRLSVRYYFHNELAPPWETSVFYTGTCCGDTRVQFDGQVQVRVQALAGNAAADSYLELTFLDGAGTLVAGDAVQVELSFHAAGYQRRVVQADDASFSSSAAGTQAEWDLCPGACAKFGNDKLTLYDDGVRVLGTPP